MRRILNYICVFAFLFMYFEPLHSLNIPQISETLSKNDDSKNAIRYPPTNREEQAGIDALIKKYMNTTATPRPRPKPSLNARPNHAYSHFPMISQQTSYKPTFNENITTNYYSTSVENYPDYAEIAPKLRKFRGFHIKDSLPPISLDTNSLIDADSNHYRSLCGIESSLIQPREIMNKNNEKVKVVNYPGQFEQVISTEECVEKDSACQYTENFSKNLKAICKQNHIIRKLVTFNDNNEAQTEDIPIPASCVCFVKEI